MQEDLRGRCKKICAADAKTTASLPRCCMKETARVLPGGTDSKQVQMVTGRELPGGTDDSMQVQVQSTMPRLREHVLKAACRGIHCSINHNYVRSARKK